MRKLSAKGFVEFIEDGGIWRDERSSLLSQSFFAKARNNLATMSILHDLMFNSKAMDILKVPDKYSSSEWVAIAGYYSMYLAAQAALAKAGYRSKSHEGTIFALEELFVKKEKLEPEYLKMLRNAELEREYLDDLREAKEKRVIAQYNPTRTTTEEYAEDIRANAPKFVNRIEKLLLEIG